MIAFDSDIGGKSWTASTINNRSVLDKEVVRHGLHLSFRC
jgi:hypothetical protein